MPRRPDYLKNYCPATIEAPDPLSFGAAPARMARPITAHTDSYAIRASWQRLPRGIRTPDHYPTLFPRGISTGQIAAKRDVKHDQRREPPPQS